MIQARGISWLCSVAVALACAAAAEAHAAGDLAPRARAGVAQTSGALALDGLGQRVEVIRDRFGVPHIYAQSEDDLFFAQGFVQAQDRLFQMELWRRSGQGRLAELLGPDFVERDRLTRLVARPPADLTQEWESYGPGARRIAERFVAGINAYVASLSGARPLEFEWAGMTPERWAPEDLLSRAEAFAMTGNAVAEVTRARIAHALGLGAAKRLMPLEPAVELAAPAGVDLAAVDAALAESLARIGSPARFVDGDGSNNWVMKGNRTSTGKPLLANDPHRTLDHPSLRYLAHLVAPGWNVIGAVTPWFPGVAIGHNERIGWGLTIFRIDAQDLVVLETDPADPRRYASGEGFERMRVARESIRVRGGEPVAVELRWSEHGPVVHEDPARNLAFALRWTGSEPGTAGYLAALALDRAQSWEEFRSALRRWKLPGENFVYADIDGNIGYQAAGLTPRRAPGSGLLPQAAAHAGRFEGWLDLDDLPRVVNPENDMVITANHNVLPVDYAHVVGYEWVERWRLGRIAEVLSEERVFSLEDFTALQQDVKALPAAELVPMLLALDLARDSQARRARDLFVGWNQQLTRESAAAALFAVWQQQLERRAFERVCGGAALELDPRQFSIAPRVLLGLLGPPGAEREALVRRALDDALALLSERLGSDPAKWRWGDLHGATFHHPLATSDARRALLDRGPIPRPGYAHTVNNTRGGDFRQDGGASFRMVLDLADWDRSVATSAPGQSGQPGSPHFDDLIEGWDQGRYFPLAFSRAKVEELAEARLVLEPAPATPKEK
jgi:penicillin amidase